jgi:hypothetical protein
MKEPRAKEPRPKRRKPRERVAPQKNSGKPGPKVERARRLIRDKRYPSKEVLRSIADLLSKKLKP